MSVTVDKQTRRAFADSYSGFSVLREIEADFEDAGLKPEKLPEGKAPLGQRRTLVAEYYEGVDWAEADDVRRILDAWEMHLLRLEARGAEEEIRRLSQTLRRGGLTFRDGRIDKLDADPSSELEQSPEHLTRIWTPDSFRLFVSHTSAFKETASRLASALEDYNVSAFVAHEDIEPSREWQQEIELALESMDGLVALLTKGFHESKWTDQEIGWALGRSVRVVTVRRDLDPYGFVAKRQAVKGRSRNVSEVAAEIVETLSKDSSTKLRMGEALAVALARSQGWDRSKLIISVLRNCHPLTPTAVDTCVRAYTRNREVRHATGAWEELKRLTGKDLPDPDAT